MDGNCDLWDRCKVVRESVIITLIVSALDQSHETLLQTYADTS